MKICLIAKSVPRKCICWFLQIPSAFHVLLTWRPRQSPSTVSSTTDTKLPTSAIPKMISLLMHYHDSFHGAYVTNYLDLMNVWCNLHIYISYSLSVGAPDSLRATDSGEVRKIDTALERLPFYGRGTQWIDG